MLRVPGGERRRRPAAGTIRKTLATYPNPMTFQQMLRREAALLTWSGEFAKTIAAAPTDYGLSLEEATAYGTTQTGYADAYAAWHNPATHTPVNRALKDEAKATLINSTRSLVAVCEAWPQMTDAKREALKIPLRDRSPSAVTLPAAAPTATTLLTGPESIRVIVRDAADENRRAKPTGVQSVVVLVTFTANGSTPELPVDQWPVASISGKTTVDLMWPNMPADQTAWVACYWLSTRSTRGPISQAESIRLPGSRTAKVAATTTDASSMKIAA